MNSFEMLPIKQVWNEMVHFVQSYIRNGLNKGLVWSRLKMQKKTYLFWQGSF